MLLDRGADIDAIHSSGYTALMYAIRYNNDELVDILIQRGASIDKLPGGGAPIVTAASGYKSDLVRKFLSLGADPNGTSKNGSQTALGYLTRNVSWGGEENRDLNLQLIRELLDAGANVNGTPGQLQSPLGGAIRSGHAAVYDLLRERGATFDFTALFASLQANNPELYREIVDSGIDVKLKNGQGETLFFAVNAKTPESIWQELIDAGVDINAVAINGETALSRLTRNSGQTRVFETMKRLLGHGADPTYTNAMIGKNDPLADRKTRATYVLRRRHHAMESRTWRRHRCRSSMNRPWAKCHDLRSERLSMIG